jgi:hypothetical protein
LRRAALTIGGFILGFVGVYAVAMGLAFLGFSTLAGLPYEQLLGWMTLAGVGLSALVLLVTRSP